MRQNACLNFEGVVGWKGGLSAQAWACPMATSAKWVNCELKGAFLPKPFPKKPSTLFQKFNFKVCRETPILVEQPSLPGGRESGLGITGKDDGQIGAFFLNKMYEKAPTSAVFSPFAKGFFYAGYSPSGGGVVGLLFA